MTRLAGETGTGISASLRSSLYYLRLGLAMSAARPGLFLQTAVLFSLPAMLAAGLVLTVEPGPWWRAAALFLLQSIATAVAPAAFMMAVSAAFAGERVSVWAVTRRAIPWLPRYLWTNVHTSVIFWVPVGSLLLVERAASAEAFGSPLGALARGTLWLVIVVAAVFLHARTVLAPFLAVHGDLPGTLAAWQSWTLSRRHLGLVVTLLLVASAPPALVLAGIGLFILTSVPSVAGSEVPAQLTSAGLQALRLTLVPAFYMLYRDLWYGPGGSGRPEERPPALVALLRAITAWLPYRPGPFPAPPDRARVLRRP